MLLFQFWDKPDPPADVAAAIAHVRALNPDLEHRLFNEGSAGRFITDHCGERHAAAFRACAVPAMQADYFRLCALHAMGGVYADADTVARLPLAGLIDPAPEALMLTFLGWMTTGLMMVRQPGHPFIASFLELATRNIEARRYRSVLLSTGPALADTLRAQLDPGWFRTALVDATPADLAIRFGDAMAHARAVVDETPGVAEAFGRMTLRPLVDVLDYIHTLDGAYKASARHWPNWRGPIYREAEQA